MFKNWRFKKQEKPKQYAGNNKGLMQLNEDFSKDYQHEQNALQHVIRQAEAILADNPFMTYTERHPIFSYIKVLTDYIQNEQAVSLLKNGSDNPTVHNKEYNIVSAYYHAIDNVLMYNLYGKSKRYEVDNIVISNATDPMIAKIWNTDRIVDNFKNIGSGIVRTHYLNNGIKRENRFEYQGINHMAQYFYPLGITMVYNGNHSIFTGMNKGEGHIKVNEVYDVSYLYDKFRFDGMYLIDTETEEKERIFFEIGAIFEIGRLLLNHHDVFSKDIQNIVDKGK
ncbi:DUF6710 family protein [Mammaliicoccus lentus]|uniref:DUF6710 family protein n=1 Tax=Mammaliicoccus lentus TaxID=42858 RepID=UPI001072039F|nr:DUF6710 family protein [Mammaliicoccus lentus]MBF0795225.1 hypothetical protein [Mammaliicoccus lentus]TFV14622.1 hypothetical protein E4T78_11195 [Mammaliicoccus lentus]